ncbi:MAG: hypothetical protein GY925_20665 [Actinomycetia bacterium]|nr:hypothetical protein [Actinomycetes bacterium]
MEELRPGDLGSFRGWIGAAGFEDLPHGRRSDPMAEAREFAVDAAVAPGRVFGGEAEDESADLDQGWWSSWSSGGMCPVAGDAATVPSQKCVWGDDPVCSLWAGERGGDGAEQGSVVVVECGSVDLAA